MRPNLTTSDTAPAPAPEVGPEIVLEMPDVTPEDGEPFPEAHDHADGADHGHEHDVEPGIPVPQSSPLLVLSQVMPTNFGYDVETRANPADGLPMTVLRIEHAAGSTVIPMSPQAAIMLGRALQDEGMRPVLARPSGLVVPKGANEV